MYFLFPHADKHGVLVGWVLGHWKHQGFAQRKVFLSQTVVGYKFQVHFFWQKTDKKGTQH